MALHSSWQAKGLFAHIQWTVSNSGAILLLVSKCRTSFQKGKLFFGRSLIRLFIKLGLFLMQILDLLEAKLIALELSLSHHVWNAPAWQQFSSRMVWRCCQIPELKHLEVFFLLST